MTYRTDSEARQDMQTKSVPFEVKREPDEDGVIEGYASVFDVVDMGMDTIAPGAFRKSLGEGRKVRMLWQHDMSSPIGVWDEVKEDERGLYVKGRISKDVQKGAEAISLYRMGAMDSLSIGYRTIEAASEGAGRVRRLEDVELWEISMVTIPMNEAAIASVKSMSTEREFERFLRDAGMSRKEATAVALHGFKGLDGLRDAGSSEVEPDRLQAVYDQIRQLERNLSNV